MANSFAVGLFHGVLVCGAALVTLSLVMPPPPRPLTPVPAVPSRSPVAADMAAPEGSEFARGSDLAPAAPAPLGVVGARADMPAVVAPADEAEPSRAEPAEAPAARDSGSEAAALTDPAPDQPALPQPPGSDPAAARAAPQGLVQPAVTAAQPRMDAPGGGGVNLSTPPDLGALRLDGPNE